jgi:hypothetical protein
LPLSSVLSPLLRSWGEEEEAVVHERPVSILLYGIPRVVVGENVTFKGPEDYVRSQGVRVDVVNDLECIQLMREFIAKNPELWNEDIGT